MTRFIRKIVVLFVIWDTLFEKWEIYSKNYRFIQKMGNLLRKPLFYSENGKFIQKTNNKYSKNILPENSCQSGVIKASNSNLWKNIENIFLFHFFFIC